jgi:agmatinase
MSITSPAVPFLESSPTSTPGAPALLGVPYEGTACFRKGTARGPDAIREVSDGLESYSPFHDRDLRDTSFADLGNVTLLVDDPEGVTKHLREVCRSLFQEQVTPVLLGGEHSFTPGAVAAALEVHPELAVLQLDAHADLREEWTATSWSHACAMRRILDLLPSDRLLQCGIRSGTREEFAELRESNRLVAPDAIDLHDALKALGSAPLYLTLDLDIFDPALLPGTGTPEPGGIDWPIFESLLAVIPWSRVVACDIVELAPALDPSDCSAILAAKIVREIVLALAHSK